MYVGRPTIFGNPFATAAEYENWLLSLDAIPELEEQRQKIFGILPELRDKDLLCFCPLGKPCHADVLIELANREE